MNNSFQNSEEMTLYSKNNQIDALDKDIDECIEKLHNADVLIGSVTTNSENEFLEIGSKLQKYLTGTRQLSSDASSIAASVSEKILKNGISELSSLLSQFSKILADSVKNIRTDREVLVIILNKVRMILNELGGFKRIVKNLRMLGIATKIESARLGTDDNGFVALADNVDNLSSMISDKADSIFRKATLLISEIGNTITDLKNLEDKNQEQSNLIISNTTHSLGAFEQKYNECFLKAEKISQSSNNVSKSISEIVTSIQFHDITRQQMEHVREALEEVIARQKHEIDMQTRASLIHDICELQTVQLKNSLNEFDGAVDTIILSLSQVEKNISDIYMEICGLLDEKKSNEQNSLKVIEKELYVISESLIKNRDIANDLAKSIKYVVEILDDLSTYVLQIEDIGTEIEIIALNARVKAARTGSNGAALGVLAEAIQKLSLEAKNQTVSTTDVLNDISNSSKNLKNNVELGSEESNKNNIGGESQKINVLLTALIDMENSTGSQIEKLNTSVNNVKNDINKTISGITIQQEVKLKVTEVMGLLFQVTKSLKIKANIKENRVKHTSGLMNKYTMNSERNIHKHFQESKNELKDYKSGIENFNDDSLGDNVELF